MAKITKKTLENTFRQARGWGHEMWIENLTEYCGKLLIIDKGKKGSLHYHMNKKETMLVQSGVLGLRLIDPDTGKEYFEFLDKGDSILIPPGQCHQIVNSGNEELVIIEFSTFHEETDSYRVQKGD